MAVLAITSVENWNCLATERERERENYLPHFV